MSNYQWENPSLTGAIGAHVDEATKNLRVAMPVKVTSFDSGKQTVSCQPMIKVKMVEGDSINLPVLVDVPVKFPRGGGFAVTFPIVSGDEGLVIIADRCIDGWWQSGGLSEPLDMRFHDLSDGFFLPGVSSVPNAIPSIDSNAIVMRKLDNSAYLKIDQGGQVEIDGTMLTVKCPMIFQNGMQGQGGSSGAAMTLTGDVQHSGGAINSNGVSLGNHTHSGVMTGGDNTGVPNK